MSTPTLTSNPSRVLRFDVAQRVTHWLNAALFSALIITAIPLFYGSLFGVIVPRHLDQEIHLWCGLALPLPLLVSLLGPWGATMRRDLRRVSYWTREELAWLRALGRRPLDADKFNPGQKFNTLFVGASTLVMLASGVILQWFRFFPVSWRGGATFVHDTLAYLVAAMIAGHVVMAFTHVDSLRSIVDGRVERAWAKKHAPAWARELDDATRDSSNF
ncbi:MAG: cytochrome b/b6 domain-containing protein [Acidobacteriota bacterium]|nr:cytochrome b/b6 domain-containing protein [Acidobacteriota bacterium]MDE3043254.1 cytochrome b/b6 domain-containing protein [Acidobacteriota bacterium]MDE3106576.1 cytochrome b/b6 domain-containing protein [Acidobacteriota bacterium]MDE3222187.1 cytochrome b/b6 domain-containing protein [Acidobacteriota bacterium]